MQKANRHARHYTNVTTHIDVGRHRSYGIATDDKGKGSANTSGCLKVGEKDRRANYAQEVAEAHAIRNALRNKKQKNRKRRAEQKINSVNERYERGQISKEERDAAIEKIRLKHKQPEARNS